MRETSEELESTNSEIEYAFEAVPPSARKKLGSILVILTGYTISLSNFVTGATVGFKMPAERGGIGLRAGESDAHCGGDAAGDHLLPDRTDNLGAGPQVHGEAEFCDPLPLTRRLGG